MVVGVFPAAQLAIEEGHLIGVGVHLIELFVVRAMRTLHVGIEFGRFGRKHKPGQLLVLASFYTASAFANMRQPSVSFSCRLRPRSPYFR